MERDDGMVILMKWQSSTDRDTLSNVQVLNARNITWLAHPKYYIRTFDSEAVSRTRQT